MTAALILVVIVAGAGAALLAPLVICRKLNALNERIDLLEGAISALVFGDGDDPDPADDEDKADEQEKVVAIGRRAA